MTLKITNLEHVPHGFFGRAGGVSTGDYGTLNCSLASEDRRENVQENRRRVLNRLASKARNLQTMDQVHKADICVVETPLDTRPQVDGLVTKNPDIALGVLTADCVPILLADAKNGVVAAVHAGWPSAFAGIVANVVAVMQEQGAQTDYIAMGIGPCIRQSSYEVDVPFYERFIAQDVENKTFFIDIADKQDTHWLFDLPQYVMAQARKAGLLNIMDVQKNTYDDASGFFSHRRHTHDHGHGRCGRQMSVISLV